MELTREQAWRAFLAEPQRPLLAACLLVLTALIAWEIWLAAEATLYHPRSRAAAASAAATQGDDVQRITAAQLFGRAPGGLQPGDQPPPETALQLTLRGVFAASNPHLASAIIETADGKAQVVKVGSAIANNTVLQQVYDNRVVLAHNGAMESLFFPTQLQSSPQSGDTASGLDTQAGDGAAPAAAGELTKEQKRANILRRLEELRARSSR